MQITPNQNMVTTPLQRDSYRRNPPAVSQDVFRKKFVSTDEARKVIAELMPDLKPTDELCRSFSELMSCYLKELSKTYNNYLIGHDPNAALKAVEQIRHMYPEFDQKPSDFSLK